MYACDQGFNPDYLVADQGTGLRAGQIIVWKDKPCHCDVFHIFVAVGLVAIGISVLLWMNGHRLKSMAYPLLAIALMQMVVGGSVYLRTETQLSTLSAQLKVNPAELKAEEITRMQTVMKNSSIYRAVEMVLLIVDIGMIAFLQRHDMAAGIGVGLVLQAAFTPTLDIFAEARGADYLSAICSLAI